MNDREVRLHYLEKRVRDLDKTIARNECDEAARDEHGEYIDPDTHTVLSDLRTEDEVRAQDAEECASIERGDVFFICCMGSLVCTVFGLLIWAGTKPRY